MEPNQEQEVDQKIIVVTEPDDYLESGFRLLLVDLNQDQTQNFTKPLLDIGETVPVICYYWGQEHSQEWLLDKIVKSDLIIYNAESDFRELVGFLKANKKAYSVGNDRFFPSYNHRIINSYSQITNIILKHPSVDNL